MFEPVHAVWDYYDGERSGFADYNGRPYYFDGHEWDTANGEFKDVFVLVPIDADTLALVLEQWQIWRAWERDFHNGKVAIETHPGKKGQDAHYDQLETEIQSRISQITEGKLRLKGTFRAEGVEWTGDGHF